MSTGVFGVETNVERKARWTRDRDNKLKRWACEKKCRQERTNNSVDCRKKCLEEIPYSPSELIKKDAMNALVKKTNSEMLEKYSPGKNNTVKSGGRTRKSSRKSRKSRRRSF
jgi:hypothetical protein